MKAINYTTEHKQKTRGGYRHRNAKQSEYRKRNSNIAYRLVIEQ